MKIFTYTYTCIILKCSDFKIHVICSHDIIDGLIIQCIFVISFVGQKMFTRYFDSDYEHIT